MNETTNKVTRAVAGRGATPCYGPGRCEYRTADTSTLGGLLEAERLHAQGWHQVAVGLFRVTFMRRKPAPSSPSATQATR